MVSVGSRGDSYDNALAESVIGLFKTEVIKKRAPFHEPLTLLANPIVEPSGDQVAIRAVALSS